MSTETIELEPKMTTQTIEIKAGPEAAPAKAPQVNSRRLWWIIGGAAAAVIAATLLWAHFRNRVSTDDAQVDGHIAPVASKIYGSVAQVLVDDNQAVKAGDVLVKIDPRDLQARVDQARAALALAQSQSQAANVTVPLTRETTSSSIAAAEADAERARLSYSQATTADLAYAQANVEKAQATADRANNDLERMKPLAAKAEISALQLDGYIAAARVAASQLQADREKLAQAKKNADIAKASLDAAEARLAEARATTKQVNVSAADANAAAAAIAQARANLEAAELQLSYTTIVAPIDGYVTHRSVEPGQIVQQGQGLMAISPRDIYITANFKETQLADVHPGQRAEVEVDMYGKTFTGRVDSIADSTGALLSLLPPENATGNFVKVVQRIPVKIVLDRVPANQPLRPGMNVEAIIFTSK